MKSRQLTNGLTILGAPLKDSKTTTVLVLVGVGSRFETKEEGGLSHFLEHMMFKGTKKRPSASGPSTGNPKRDWLPIGQFAGQK